MWRGPITSMPRPSGGWQRPALSSTARSPCEARQTVVGSTAGDCAGRGLSFHPDWDRAIRNPVITTKPTYRRPPVPPRCSPQAKVWGAKVGRAELAKAIGRLEEGDVLIVTRLDRLARSTRDLLNVIEAVSKRAAGLA